MNTLNDLAVTLHVVDGGPGGIVVLRDGHPFLTVDDATALAFADELTLVAHARQTRHAAALAWSRS